MTFKDGHGGGPWPLIQKKRMLFRTRPGLALSALAGSGSASRAGKVRGLLERVAMI